MGTFSCAQIDLRKGRERELATFDGKSTSTGIAEPYARQKNESKNRGEEGTTPVTTACPEAEKKCVEKKKNLMGTHTPSSTRDRSITHSLFAKR